MFEVALEVLNILNKNYEAYIVGGYPRNSYLNKESLDIDICTNAKPNQISKLFKKYKINKYGSILIYYKNYKFEITTFRKEIEYLDNRHPSKFIYVDSLKEDLNRRDFIINTMCIDSNNNLIDLLDAKSDLDNKIIRTVGNSKLKIKEDALRILRAIRFAVTLDFKLDNELKEAIKEYNYLLENISLARKKEELDKIFKSNYKYGLQLIKELNLDKYLDLNLNNFIEIDNYLGIWYQLNKNYPFTKYEKNILNKINELYNKNIIDNKILFDYGLDICLVVGILKNIDKNIIINKYNNLPIKNINNIKISKREVIKILNNDYKKANEIYSNIIDKILNNELKNDKEALINFINF